MNKTQTKQNTNKHNNKNGCAKCPIKTQPNETHKHKKHPIKTKQPIATQQPP